ncbi:MAG TPA: M13-type metalloendopeptidase [Gemmatimonadaceae bacterium]|nr:M13-type metalloendopeptidase [Gemmatimonadaceae bacterium]
MHSHLRFPLAAAAAALLAASASAQQQQASPVRALGVDTTNFDRAVRPQDDFFRFVNGAWLTRTEIPADASSWGAFNELTEKSRTAIHQIVEAAAKSNAPAGSEQRKIGDLYASYMDSARIEQLGTKPLEPTLAEIAAVKSTKDLPSAFAKFARLGLTSPFGVRVGQDPKQSTVNIVQIGQSGLGLPDRDYYLRTDAKTAAIRSAYENYITTLFTLTHQPDPAGAAQRIVALETQIATPQWDRAKSRNRDLSYNRFSRAQLEAATPAYDWNTYLTTAGLGKASDVIVGQPDYLKAMNEVIATTPVSTWREYLTFKLLDSYADELPAAFQNAHFEFRNKTLSGQQEMSARWKRGVAEVESMLGEAAGKLYVQQYFKPEAKARMDALVKNILAAYKVGIDSLEWMSPATKQQAQEKLAHFTVKIGYPDKWRDYSKLTIERNDLFGNAERAARFRYDDMVSQLGRPVDRTRWGMTPQTVNAYYNSVNNEIVFPAAILQPPFFNVDADDAVNYGAIGAVIGHEIGHGFDDQGRKSDGSGNLRDWWTADDAQKFQERTQKLGAEYAALEQIDDLHINPGLTMGENIGDNSGLAQAYRAYKISLKGHEAPVIDGFTGDQRFFLGYGQIWRTKFRDAALRNQLLTNPHSPGMARAFIPLTNNDAFMKAFNVQPGDKMYRAPGDRVKIW